MITTIIEMSRLESLTLIVEEDGKSYLQIRLFDREEKIYIHEDNASFEAYKAIFEAKKAQLDQYLENIKNKAND